MSIKNAYNSWAENYDEVENKTRDLEEFVVRKILISNYNHVLELGCGTGKNTVWLSQQAKQLTGLDFSEEILIQAKQKVSSKKVTFKKLNLLNDWSIEKESVDLITCSLVLEHFKDLDQIFNRAFKSLINNGEFYLCELHPFKQYSGGKARFIKEDKLEALETYIHNISDYMEAAERSGFKLKQLKEWYDDNKTNIPRLISFIFVK